MGQAVDTRAQVLSVSPFLPAGSPFTDLFRPTILLAGGNPNLNSDNRQVWKAGFNFKLDERNEIFGSYAKNIAAYALGVGSPFNVPQVAFDASAKDLKPEQSRTIELGWRGYGRGYEASVAVYDVKFDGRHKSRFVAGGHRTDTPIESTYSGVVSLLGVRTVTFLAELKELELWSTDIGNAYLESYTSEKVAFVAGGEFGEYAGQVMIIVWTQVFRQVLA